MKTAELAEKVFNNSKCFINSRGEECITKEQLLKRLDEFYSLSVPITEDEIAGIIYKDLRGFLRKHEDCKRTAELCAETLKYRLQSDAVVFTEWCMTNKWILGNRKGYLYNTWSEEFKTTQELYNSQEFKDFKNNLKK